MSEESLGDTVLVLQHQDDAGPGNLASWLDTRDLTWQLVDVSVQPLPPVAPRRALIVLGSRESVYDDTVPWLAAETAFVKATIATGTPVLGLCFGAQLLASVLGGTVSKAPSAERGWIDVLATLDDSSPAARSPAAVLAGQWFAWHQDHIQPPPGSVVLAHSDRCVQGFAEGRHLGVQFHPEVTFDQVHSWLSHDRRGRQLHEVDGDAEQLLHSTRQLQPQATSAAAHLYEAFFRS